MNENFDEIAASKQTLKPTRVMVSEWIIAAFDNFQERIIRRACNAACYLPLNNSAYLICILLQPFQIQLNNLKNDPIINTQRRPTWKRRMVTAATAPITNICPHNMDQIACKGEVPKVESNCHYCWEEERTRKIGSPAMHKMNPCDFFVMCAR